MVSIDPMVLRGDVRRSAKLMKMKTKSVELCLNSEKKEDQCLIFEKEEV